MSQSAKNGVIISPKYSPAYIAHYPCWQATTDTTLKDKSGNGRDATFGAGLTAGEAWGTANKFSGVDVATEDFARLAQASFPYDYSAGDSLIIAARINMAAPSASRTLFANGYNNGTAQGFRLYAKNTGVLAPMLYQTGGDKFLSDTTPVIADGADHTMMFAWFSHDPVAGTAKYMAWIDGVRAYSGETAATGLTTIAPVMGLNISGNNTGAAAYQGTAAHMDNIHILRTAAVKVWSYETLDKVATRLHRSIAVPLNALEFPAT